MANKQYGSAEQYEKKLATVMERLGASEYNWNWDRHGCWVEFRYRGQLYRFDHSVEKAKSAGVNLRYGSDAFAQVVLSLQDLTRMVERGIYDFQTWVSGMKYLPPAIEVPQCFRALGYEELPAGADEVKARYRSLAKKHHPDFNLEDPEADKKFKALYVAAEQCMQHFNRSLK